MTRTWIGIVVFVLVLCLASPAAWAMDVTIAVLVPLTVAGAFYGKVMRDIATGVIVEINSKGGVKGFGEMKYRVYDTATDPAVTASMIERAHSQGATFLWGGFSSSVESMMVKKANELNGNYSAISRMTVFLDQEPAVRWISTPESIPPRF